MLALMGAAHALDLEALFNPRISPFIPIPEIGLDPDTGTTIGLIPAVLRHNTAGEVDRIYAPDISYNSYFGWGVRGRIFDYPSDDTRWSLIAGLQQRVGRKFDAEYETGRTRDEPLTFAGGLLYERSGAQRFFGFGNDTPQSAEVDYTNGNAVFQGLVGWNMSRAWQLAYVLRARNVDITEGTVTGLPSITTQYPSLPGLGSHGELLNRVMLTYDTRDDTSIPTHGVRAVLYGSLSSRNGFFNDSLYSEVGFDVRDFVPLTSRTVLALHVALRELPSFHELPFWAYSTIGGDQSIIGGPEPLRGFPQGRFTDVNSSSGSVELRQTVGSLQIAATRVFLELAPFIDVGQVFPRTSDSPIGHLHRVYGLGVNALARPYIVAYVDIGYGSDGIAAFSGINYVF